MSQPWRHLSRSNPNSPSPLSLSTPSNESPLSSSSEISPSRIERPRRRQGWEKELDEQLGGLELNRVTINPEVDKSGHTEYKLHLLSPAPHRFEKLKTQLKWRLIEGGSQALYELGVVDDGTLVGLSKQDMDGSLDTLGRMLAGLGGGQVRVNKVFKLAGDGSRDHGLTAAQHQMQELGPNEATELFSSFWVEGKDEVTLPLAVADDDDGLFPASINLDLDLDLSLDAPLPPPQPAKTNAPVHHSPAFCGRRYKKYNDPQRAKDKAAHHWPERTPEERAARKREKRDKGRRRSDGQLALSSLGTEGYDTAIGFDVLPPAPKPSSARPIPAANQRKPSLKLSKSEPKPSAVANKLRPSLLREGEERWVVEVQVFKRSGGKKGEGVVVEESETDVEGEDEGDEPEHGWQFLDFDFLGPNGGVAAPR